MSENPVIEVENIRAYYETRYGDVKAVDNVSFSVKLNEIFGICGESGCGKSTLIKVLYGIIEFPLKLVSGRISINIDGKSFLLKDNKDVNTIRKLWWKEISYIPQASMNLLNPTVKIKDQFMEIFRKMNKKITRSEAEKIMQKSFDVLGLPKEVLSSYPHQLSGGMRQRVVIAMATIHNPKIVYADEPTTALDVVVQRGILEMIVELQKKLNNTFVIVTHDMGIHYQISDRIMVMYAGKVCEIGKTYEIFQKPIHPYTKLLIESLPRLGDKSERKSIKGEPPNLLSPPKGCRFHVRCPYAAQKCAKEEPSLLEILHGRYVACFNPLS
ncbi:MAG: ABC transporter ATP-binding protein [Candidatus Bathyarchaeia archaeon]